MYSHPLAFSTKHPYVPNTKDYRQSRWIASLSDGSTVFEDRTPNIKSAWRRLREYVEYQGLKVTGLRLEAYGRQINLVPYRDGAGNPQLNGYWHSKRMNALLTSGGVIEGQEVGIGFLKAGELVITWVSEDGSVRQEVRDYSPNDEAVIVNDCP
jgi:hypothetical protein